MIVCRISIPLPESYPTYHRKIALAHPDLQFLVLDRVELEPGLMLEDVRVSGGPTDDTLLSELRAGRGVKKAELLERTKLSTVFRLEMETTPFIKSIVSLRLVARPPFPFTGGVGKVLMVAERGKVVELLAQLRDVAPDVNVESIRRDTIDGARGLLTPRQLEVFKLAMSAGYWDIPRRAKLADIAALTNVSKSTIAETLATVEKKLLSELRGQELARPELWFAKSTG